MTIRNQLIVTLTAILLTWATVAHAGVMESVLSEGKWVRVSVDHDGVYKISYDDLVAWGFENPEAVRVYGFGGHPLPESFSQKIVDDLPIVPTWKSAGDGILSKGDYLLFYARGSVSWTYDKAKGTFTHTPNPYSDKGYYFLSDRTPTTTERNLNQTALTAKPDATGHDTARASMDYAVYENELSKPQESGRKWYGETFNNATPKNFDFTFAHLLPDSSVNTRVTLITQTSSSTTMTATAGDATLNISLPALNSSYVANEVDRSFKANVTDDDVNVSLRFNGSAYGTAQLDYIEVNAWRDLVMEGDETTLRFPQLNGGSSDTLYSWLEGDETLLWNVSDLDSIYAVATYYDGTRIHFKDKKGNPSQYVAVKSVGDFPAPDYVETVDNQNLHGASAPQLVIISHPDFLSQAEQIAELHRQHDNMNVLVCTPQQVFNEFSSGTADATAFRLLMRHYYDQDKTVARNLLLVGDGTYDNKGYLSVNQPYNKILTYQSEESTQNTIYSYVSDDYFTLLDNEDGADVAFSTQDIGVGRLPVTNETQANRMVEKIRNYLTTTGDDHWKNRAVFIADDDNNNNLCFTWQSDTLARYTERDRPEVQTIRLFTDAYTKVVKASSATYPTVNARLLSLFNSGTLLFNYLGHGSTEGLSAEKFFDRKDITTLHNEHLPIFFTGTCDFAVYDNAGVSAGEQLILNETGGVSALFSTSRTVYANDNYVLDRSFIRYFFEPDNEGKGRFLGHVQKDAKNDILTQGTSINVNKLSYMLLGDPALRVPLARKIVVIDSVKRLDQRAENPTYVDSTRARDTVSALSRIMLKGRVLNPDSTESNTFNGSLKVTVMDKAVSMTTLGNASSGEVTYTYQDRTSTLFSGKVKVDTGTFNIVFETPKDIDYRYGNGKINLFAIDTTSHETAIGYDTTFVVGGSDPYATKETSGPLVSLYLNSPHFVSGDKVDATSIFYATLSDMNGINTTGSGIGHDLQITLGGDTSATINLNDYYENDFGSYQSGRIAYVLPSLSSGKYTLTLRAWDLMNNSSSATITFRVAQGNAPELYHVTPYPNPANALSGTTFRIEHDQPETDLDFTLSVYDISGQLMWRNKETIYSGTSETLVHWNLRTSSGQHLQPGNYIYRFKVGQAESDDSYAAGHLIVADP